MTRHPAAGLELLTPAAGAADSRVLLGALCEIVLVIAIVGSAVALYPVVRRENESIALGLVAGRLLEAAGITVGMVSMLAMVTLRDEGASSGADEGVLVAVNQALIALHDWTFPVGPSILLGLNTLMLAYFVHRMRLVPWWMATLGLVGGPLIIMSAIAVLFGLYSPTGHAVSAIPVFAWEVGFAIYLVVKGFQPARPRRPWRRDTCTPSSPALTAYSPRSPVDSDQPRPRYLRRVGRRRPAPSMDTSGHDAPVPTPLSRKPVDITLVGSFCVAARHHGLLVDGTPLLDRPRQTHESGV